jgi:hypothetical protein
MAAASSCLSHGRDCARDEGRQRSKVRLASGLFVPREVTDKLSRENDPSDLVQRPLFGPGEQAVKLRRIAAIATH